MQRIRAQVQRLLGAGLAALLVLTGALVLPELQGAAIAGAAPATTQHLLPSNGAEGVNYVCQDAGYDCTSGYTGDNVPASMWNAYGCDNASGCPDTPHNCYLWVVYRLDQEGIVPTWTADATEWDTQAAATGVPVDQTPAVGSIAQWNGPDTAPKGHVGWVSAVGNDGTLQITMDWWGSETSTPAYPGGYTAWITIAPDSPAYPDNFLHYEQRTTGAAFNASPSSGTAPLQVKFNNTSDSGATDFTWDFGDGSVSSSKNPTHTYGTKGTYKVKLTAGNSLGSTSVSHTVSVSSPSAPGGYILDGFGGLHRYRSGTGPLPATPSGNPYWPGWDIARGIAQVPGTGGYVLDGFGGLHRFKIDGSAKPPATTGAPYWQGWDIARGVAVLPDGTGGYVVDGFGGLHAFGIGSNSAPPAAVGGPYWNGQDVARGVMFRPNGKGGYVVDSRGALHPFKVGNSGSAPGTATGVAIVSGVQMQGGTYAGSSGFTVDGFGGTHPFGVGSAPAPPAVTSGPYWPGWNIARDIATVIG